MTRLLKALGLMTVAEHERAMSGRVSIPLHNDVVDVFKGRIEAAEAKYKRAITDLAAAREEVALVIAANEKLRFDNSRLAAASSSKESEIDALRPDALAMRRKREMDRDRAAGKRGKGQ